MPDSSSSQVAGRISLISLGVGALFTVFLTISSLQNWSGLGEVSGAAMVAAFIVFAVSGFVKLAHIFVEKFFNRS